MNQNSWLSMVAIWMYLSAGFHMLADGLTALTWFRGSTTCNSSQSMDDYQLPGELDMAELAVK
jgi:hypothetical protein